MKKTAIHAWQVYGGGGTRYGHLWKYQPKRLETLSRKVGVTDLKIKKETWLQVHRKQPKLSQSLNRLETKDQNQNNGFFHLRDGNQKTLSKPG